MIIGGIGTMPRDRSATDLYARPARLPPGRYGSTRLSGHMFATERQDARH